MSDDNNPSDTAAKGAISPILEAYEEALVDTLSAAGEEPSGQPYATREMVGRICKRQTAMLAMLLALVGGEDEALAVAIKHGMPVD